MVHGRAFQEADDVATFPFLCAEGASLYELEVKLNFVVAQLLSVIIQLLGVGHTLATARRCVRKSS